MSCEIEKIILTNIFDMNKGRREGRKEGTNEQTNKRMDGW